MKLKHRVRINIVDKNGIKQEVLESTSRRIPRRLLHFLFGDFCEVLVLSPGETVQGIEIREMRGDRKHPRVQFHRNPHRGHEE